MKFEMVQRDKTDQGRFDPILDKREGVEILSDIQRFDG